MLIDAPVAGEAPRVQLPTVDIRTRLNERAIRGWTESSRRLARVVVLLASDIAAGLAGVWLVIQTWGVVSAGGRRPLPDEVPLVAMVFCLMPLALRVTGAYAGGKARTDLLRVAAGVAIAAFFGWIQAQLFGREVPERPNKTAYVYAFTLITALAWVCRLVVDRVVTAAYDAGVLQRRVLVVGTAEEAEELARRAAMASGCELAVVGRLAPERLSDVQREIEGTVSRGRVPFAGDAGEVGDALSRTRAQGLVVASNLSFTSLEMLTTACFRSGATLSVMPQGLGNLSGTQIESRQSAVGVLLQLRPLQLGVPQLAVKRTMDVVLAGVGLALVAPLMALIAVAVKLDSKGPVLFRQTRLGVGGRPFRIVKFRTMVDNADVLKADLQHLNEYPDGRLFKIRDDPRITRVGRYLRRLSLDELPQLWNVLRGDMSLVGPRPCVPEEFAHYAPHHMERLFVLPGLTGPWQVNGRSTVLDFEEVVRMDQEYIRSWSLVQDLVILLRTVPALFARGAY